MDPADLNAHPDEMWANLGDWRHTVSYGSAARALAMRVGRSAQLTSRDVVVDYACGFGDSLRVWVEAFGVRRAVGVEPDPDVCEMVRARIARWGLTSRLTVVAARAEDCAPTAADAAASAVVCVDAAYHFRTRLDWWRMVARTMPAGARIAACDLLLADGRRAGLVTRAAAAALRIPAANLCDAAACTHAIAETGITALQVESVAAEVLDGFIAHAPRRSVGVQLTRVGVRAFRRRLDYVVLSGVAPGA